MFRRIINRWNTIRAHYAIVFTTFTVVLTILSAIATLEKLGALKPQTAGWVDQLGHALLLVDARWNVVSRRVALMGRDR